MFSGGRQPFGGQFAAAETLRHFSALNYIPASRFNPLIPTWIDGALKKALSINPALRYEVFSEFLADLEHPNPAFLASSDLPLAERDPLLFWKAISAVLGAIVVLLTWLLLKSA